MSDRDTDTDLTDFWDRSRAYYEQAAATNAELAAERGLLLEHLEGGERLLDLGCGSCENALWVPPECRYVGVDVSTVALRMADEAGRPGLRTRGNAGALPFADQCFDAVLSTWVLEHLADPGRVFAEAARVLRPGGLLLLVGSAWDLPYEMPPSLDPGRRLEVTLRRLFRQATSLFGSFGFDIVEEPRVLREGYVPDADAVFVVQGRILERFLEALGFAVVCRRSLPHGPPPTGLRGLYRSLLRRVPLWRFAWGNFFLVARRRSRLRRPRYRLRYL